MMAATAVVAAAVLAAPSAGRASSVAAPAGVARSFEAQVAAPAKLASQAGLCNASPGRFWDVHAGGCGSCAAGCSSCAGETAAECTGCESGLALRDGQCVARCGHGRFRSSEGECQRCHAECGWHGCDGAGPGRCRGCAGVSHRGECVPTCPAGTLPGDDQACWALADAPLSGWLRRHGLAAYAAPLWERGVTFDALALMGAADLERQLGVADPADRERLLAAIHELQLLQYRALIDLTEALGLDKPLLQGDKTGAGAHDNASAGAGDADGGEPGGGAAPPPPCPFGSAGDFMSAFGREDAVRRFEQALCLGCELNTALARGIDCRAAKRALRSLMLKYHPDKVHAAFPGCAEAGIDLQPWATTGVMELTRAANDFCHKDQPQY